MNNQNNQENQNNHDNQKNYCEDCIFRGMRMDPCYDCYNGSNMK